MKMSKKQNQNLKELDRIYWEDYLKIEAGEKIYPPLDDGKCDSCERYIRELKPFGGHGDPLDTDYTGALLVKTTAPLAPYIEEVEKDWMIDKFGKEKAEAFDYAHFYHHDGVHSWECRDCVVLNMDEYSEILKRKLERLGYQKPYYLPKGWSAEEHWWLNDKI
jgi:hypothetical protein